MVNTKISQLPQAGSVHDDSQFEVVTPDGGSPSGTGTSEKVWGSQLRDYIFSATTFATPINGTGDGSTTTLNLNVALSSVYQIILFIDGIFQRPGVDFTWPGTGTTITFTTTPASGQEIRGLVVGAPMQVPAMGGFAKGTRTGDASTVAFSLATELGTGNVIYTPEQVMMYVDGAFQTPGTDFTVSGATVTFTTAPRLNAQIQFVVIGTVLSSQLAAAISYNNGTSGMTATTAQAALDELAAYVPPPSGRVTLEAGVPVSTTDQTAKTAVKYTPYKGNRLPVYMGAVWKTVTFVELSLALDSNSGHTGYHQSGKNFDLFYAYVSGTLYFGSGPAWTSDIARSAAVSLSAGVYVNTATMTLRYGSNSGDTVSVPAGQATLLGSFRASADGQTQVKFGSVAASGGEAWIGIWSAYNRVPVSGVVRDSTDTWSYTTATIRALNASNTNRVSILQGLTEDGLHVTLNVGVSNGAGVFGATSVGLDSTTAIGGLGGQSSSGNSFGRGHGTYSGNPGLGFHYIQALEYASGATVTFYGDAGVSYEQSGLSYRWSY